MNNLLFELLERRQCGGAFLRAQADILLASFNGESEGVFFLSNLFSKQMVDEVADKNFCFHKESYNG